MLTKWRTSFSDPPLADWCMRLTAPDATPDTRRTAAEVLRWAVDHIQFSREDESEIRAALNRFSLTG